MPDMTEVYRGNIPRLPRREESHKKIQDKREQLAKDELDHLELKLIEYARNVIAQKNENSYPMR